MPGASPGVVGRADALRAVERFLAGVPGGADTLVISGEAGIGKTTIWRYAVALARSRGFAVLDCHPARPEANLTLSGLSDLLSPIVDAVADEIPVPQREALEVALLRRPGSGAPLDRRTLGAGALSAVRALASRGPVLLAIDDVQWLDEASTHLVAYVARRLVTEPVGLLMSQRTAPARPDALPPDGLGASHEPEPCRGARRLPLDHLDLPSLHRLLLTRLATDLPRPTLLRIHQTSGGNPFFALEIARTMVGRDPWLVPGSPPPVPASLLDLVTDRIRALDERVRDALLHVAVSPQPTVGTIRLALGAEPGRLSALTPAEEHGLITIHGDRIRFTHPLFSCAVHAAASAERRQCAHRRLAEVVPDLEQRARHLALAVDGPDAEVADLLERGAKNAWHRGAPGAAAELWELARSRTPDSDTDACDRRVVAEAMCLFAVGATARARTLLRGAIERMAPGVHRALANRTLAEIVFYEGGTVQASRLCGRAFADAAGDPHLLAELLLRRAWYSTHDSPGQLSDAQASVDLLVRLGDDADPQLAACALAVAAMYRLTNGKGIAADDLRRARALLSAGDGQGWAAISARQALGAWAKCLDPVDARRWFADEHRRAVECGDEPAVGHTLMHLAEIDCWLGDWATARIEAAGSVEAIRLTGQHRWLGFGLYARALVQAHLGEVTAASESAAEGLALAEQTDDPYVAALIRQVLGFLALSTGDPERADEHLSRAAGYVDAMRLREPARYMFHGDQVEAAVAVGATGRARLLLDRMRERVRVAPRALLLASTARAEAVLAAAEGDPTHAEVVVRRSIRTYEALRMPFETGRCLLLLGRILRSTKRKLPARDALARAERLFAGLGAALWRSQAATDLARCGAHRVDEGELTPTEERVAGLVAEGLTNNEVAARLFISAKTVEANLTRIYRKLAVGNRRELTRRYARR